MSGVAVARDAAGLEGLAPVRRGSALSARRLGVLALILAGCAGAAWYGYGWWTVGRFMEVTDDAYVGGDVTTISPHAAGFVTEILVADNAHVQAGQVLVRLDTRDYRAALARTQAAVAARMAAAEGLRAQLVLQRSMVAQAGAELDATVARAAFTRIDGARYATLASTNAGSRQEAERTHVADQEAQARWAAARAALDAARLRIGVLDAQVSEADAAAAGARADLQRASLDLGYTEIRAPVEGYVGNRAAHLGAFVAEGSYLLSIIPAHGLWVDANFKEDQLAPMLAGQAAQLSVDGAPGVVFHGSVLSVAPGTGAIFSVIPPENATGNFTRIVQRVPVRIALDAADGTLSRLRPGLSVTVSVDTRSVR